jgi:hypothetical protein
MTAAVVCKASAFCFVPEPACARPPDSHAQQNVVTAQPPCATTCCCRTQLSRTTASALAAVNGHTQPPARASQPSAVCVYLEKEFLRQILAVGCAAHTAACVWSVCVECAWAAAAGAQGQQAWCSMQLAGARRGRDHTTRNLCLSGVCVWVVCVCVGGGGQPARAAAVTTCCLHAAASLLNTRKRATTTHRTHARTLTLSAASPSANAGCASRATAVKVAAAACTKFTCGMCSVAR